MNPLANVHWRVGAGQHGDTTRAAARLAEIREQEHLALKVDQRLIDPIEEQLARYRPRFKAIVDGILARPYEPARPGERPVERLPIAVVVAPRNDPGFAACSPTAIAVALVCGCRWPIGHPNTVNFHFCNKKRAVHFYCEEHERKSRK